jgi:hypothetical protein
LHYWHVAEPTPLNVPAGQIVQDDAIDELNDPALHEMHYDASY